MNHILASLIRFERFEWMLEKATEWASRELCRSRPSAAKGVWSRPPENASRDGTELFVRRVSNPGGLGCLKSAPHCLADALQMEAAYRYVLEEAEAPPIFARSARASPARRLCSRLLVGPEGGWTDREREQIAVLLAGRPVSLGREILRAETAAIAALAIVNAAWGDALCR